MRQAKITAETTETLKRERGNGATYADIAARTGVSAKYLAAAAVELGLTRSQFAWTDEAVATIRDLWGKGFSASQIARRLDGDVSRNAVIGKLTRLGLSGRSNKITRTYAPKTKMQRRSAAAKKARRTRERFEEARAVDVAAVIMPPEDVPIGATTLTDMRQDQCRWPYGDGPFLFCPEVRAQSMSYCLGHAQKAFRPLPPKGQKQ